MSKPLDPRLLRAVPALRPFLIVVAICQLLGAALVVAQVSLLASSVVTVFSDHEFGRPLATRLVLLAAVGVVRSLLAGGQEFVVARASVRVRADLRRSTLQAIVRLGPAWAGRQPSGRLANATGPGLDALDGYLTRALPALVSVAVIPPVVLIAIAATDWQSGLLLLLMLPLVPLFMALVGVTTRRRMQRQYLLLGRLSGQFLDLLRGLTTLRIYGQAGRQQRTLREATERYRTETMSALKISFLSALVLDLVAALSVAVVAVDVGLRLDSAGISFSTALIVLLLAPELFAPLRSFGAQYHASEQGLAASGGAIDIIELAAAASENAAPAADASPCRSDGNLVLDGVTVRFPDRGAPALDRMHLHVQAGELVVLQGRSGAGKSTVLAALLGFVRPDSGEVVVGRGGELSALAGLDPRAWRANVAWLPQRPVPSRDTVAAEVRLGNPDATDEEVAAACAACRSPAPLTLLGQDGQWVSAGQRRRIALARVLLRSQAVLATGCVPIVLLDEPSEDLDRDTELVVAQVIVALRGRATVIVATHSQVLAELADRRVRVAQGRVVEIVRQEAASEPAPAAPASTEVADPPRPRADSPAPAFVLPRLRELAKREGVAGKLVTAGALSAVAGLTGLGLTASSTWLISRAAEHPNVQALALAVVGVRTFAIARALLRYAERLSAHDGALRLLAGLRVRVFAALCPLAPSSVATYGRGDLLRRFVGDVDGIQDGLVRAFVPLTGALITAAGAVTLAAYLAPVVGLILGVALLLGGLGVPWSMKYAVGDPQPASDVAGERDALSMNAIEALPELTAYGADHLAIRGVSRLDKRFGRASARAAAAAAAGVFLSGTAAAITLPAVLLAGAAAVQDGRLNQVSLAVLAVCVLIGFVSVAPLPAAFVAWTRCRAGLARVAAVLSGAPSVPEPLGPVSPPTDGIGVLAQDLTLTPAAGATPVLAVAELCVRAGTRVAVTGPSGCGKSTLLSAALRLLPVDAGLLAITGSTELDRAAVVAISDVGAADLPVLVAGSLQGDHVFDASLRDNLRVVRPDASDQQLDEVAARAGLVEFIQALPMQWSTPAGPDGSSLSGGQRQRLLLARALLADPAVLLLDEPTAHLDAETERAVLADLLDATSGRTVLLSTHRRLGDDQVDQVLLMEHGQLKGLSPLKMPAAPALP